MLIGFVVLKIEWMHWLVLSLMGLSTPYLLFLFVLFDFRCM